MLCISYDIGLLETDVSRLGCTILSDCPELLRNFLLSCQFTDRFTRNRCSKARMHQGQLRSKALKDIVARRAGALSQHQHDLEQHISQVGFCKEEQKHLMKRSVSVVNRRTNTLRRSRIFSRWWPTQKQIKNCHKKCVYYFHAFFLCIVTIIFLSTWLWWCL